MVAPGLSPKLPHSVRGVIQSVGDPPGQVPNFPGPALQLLGLVRKFPGHVACKVPSATAPAFLRFWCIRLWRPAFPSLPRSSGFASHSPFVVLGKVAPLSHFVLLVRRWVAPSPLRVGFLPSVTGSPKVRFEECCEVVLSLGDCRPTFYEATNSVALLVGSMAFQWGIASSSSGSSSSDGPPSLAYDSDDEDWDIHSSSSSSSSSESTTSELDIAPGSVSEPLPLFLMKARGLGDCEQLALRAMLQPKPATAGDEVKKFVQRYLGPVPPAHAGKTLEAGILGMDRRTLTVEHLSLASAVFYTSRVWRAAFCRSLMEEISGGRLTAHTAVRFFMSDETTLKSGKHLWRGDTEVVEAGPLKMVQSECVMGFLVQSVDTGRYQFFTLPCVIPLQAADRNTGEAMYVLWREAMMCSASDLLFKKFPNRLEARTVDRAGSNLRAVRKLDSDADSSAVDDVDTLTLNVTFCCDAHGNSSVTGRVLEPVQGMLTGLISVSLALRMGGFFAHFKKILTSIIASSVTVVDAAPFSENHPWSQRRDGLLKLLLPPTCSRRVQLHSLLTGDPTDDHIELRRPGGATDDEVKEYAKVLADQLMPAQLPIFSRTRWLGSAKPISEAALVGNFHRLLPRTTLAWTWIKLGGDSAQVGQAQQPHHDWDVVLSDSDSDGEKEPGAAGVPAKGSPEDWAAWNAKQQRNSRQFARGAPQGCGS